jgi:hypothetical protein
MLLGELREGLAELVRFRSRQLAGIDAGLMRRVVGGARLILRPCRGAPSRPPGSADPDGVRLSAHGELKEESELASDRPLRDAQEARARLDATRERLDHGCRRQAAPPPREYPAASDPGPVDEGGTMLAMLPARPAAPPRVR